VTAVAPAPDRLAARLARRVPRIDGLLDDRDRWHAEALDRRARAAGLRRELDRVTAAAAEAAAAAQSHRRRSDAAHAEELARLRSELAAATGCTGAATARVRSLEADLAAEQAHYAWLRRRVGSWLPGHFYSPIPDWDEIRERAGEVFAVPAGVPGIDFRAADQLARLAEFAGYYAEHTFPVEPTPDHRFCLHNRFFGWADGLTYYCMLRSLRPARVLEIGSGWSSALLLDVDEEFLGNTVRTTFVEPFTERLDELLHDADRDRVTIIASPLWEVGPEPFAELGPGDVLFIDSTHVSRIGSDVNRLVLDVLPTLPAGVHVHVHDVFYPFEYPKAWIEDGRAWNEAYLLRAYLIDNPTVRITWANSYLRRFHRAEVTAAMPQWGTSEGGSLWFETLPAPGRSPAR